MISVSFIYLFLSSFQLTAWMSIFNPLVPLVTWRAISGQYCNCNYINIRLSFHSTAKIELPFGKDGKDKW